MNNINEIVNGVCGPLVAGFWSHLHLFRYGTFLYQKFRKQSHLYKNEQDFWRDLIGNQFYEYDKKNWRLKNLTTSFRHKRDKKQLRLYDIVNLKNFQLTEWFPRCPGVFWTKEGVKRRTQADNNIERITEKYRVYTPKGKYLMVTGGIGTTRILSRIGPTGGYRILCATSSGICDAGIPVVVSEEVCSAINDPIVENQGIEVDLEGILLGPPFNPLDIVIPARGARLESELRDWLSTSLHIPRYFILVESSLQVKRYVSDFRLIASAWTLFSREDYNEYVPSFTYATFDPKDEGSLDQATDFINDYVKKHDGKVIYTDFDEHVRRLDSKYSLKDVINGTFDEKEGQHDLEDIIEWGTNIEEVSPQR